MTVLAPEQRDRDPRSGERGNVVLIAALIVLALGAAAVSVSQLVMSRMNYSADLRLSNYAGTLAQNVAESGINNLLYNWDAGLASPPALGTLTAFPTPALTTSYGGGPTVRSNATYSVSVSGSGPYTVVAQATVSTDPTVPGSTVWPSAPWRTVTRTVTATIASGSVWVVTGYTR